MTALLNIFKPPLFPYFLAEFENSCIKINGLVKALLQDILTIYIAFPFNILTALLNKLPHYIWEESNLRYRHVRLRDLDIPRVN